MSMTENQQKVEVLITSLLQKLSSDIPQDVVVFGSAAIILNGVDLEREIDDLDIFVSDLSYEELKANPLCREFEKKPGVFALNVIDIDKVEIFKTFLGVSHASVLEGARALPNSYGTLVAVMDDLCRWKHADGGEKALRDLPRMGC